jgi:hypothetical protein
MVTPTPVDAANVQYIEDWANEKSQESERCYDPTLGCDSIALEFLRVRFLRIVC